MTKLPVAVATSISIVITQLLSTEIGFQAVTQHDMSVPDPPTHFTPFSPQQHRIKLA